MSALVVQERHLWLCLADMEQEKVQFLNAPVSQTGLETGYMAEYQGGHATRYSPGSDYTGLKQKPSSPWTDPSFLRARVPLEQIFGHAVLLTAPQCSSSKRKGTLSLLPEWPDRPVALTSIVMKVCWETCKEPYLLLHPCYLGPSSVCPNRSTDDAISHVLHSSLTHITPKMVTM